MKVEITMTIAELKQLALPVFQKVNPNIKLADIQENIEGQYEDRNFVGFKVEINKD